MTPLTTRGGGGGVVDRDFFGFLTRHCPNQPIDTIKTARRFGAPSAHLVARFHVRFGPFQFNRPMAPVRPPVRSRSWFSPSILRPSCSEVGGRSCHQSRWLLCFRTLSSPDEPSRNPGYLKDTTLSKAITSSSQGQEFRLQPGTPAIGNRPGDGVTAQPDVASLYFVSPRL